LYDEVSPARRQRLHRAIGQALAERDAGTTAQRLADLAFHFVRAGDAERGVRYALAAGDAALQAQAAAEAAAHYQAAYDLLTLQQAELRVLALLGLGSAAMLLGEYGRAVASFRLAAEDRERRGDLLAAA